MLFRFLLCVCLLFQISHSKTHEEIKAWFFRQALECNKEHPITADEMQMLQKQKLPGNKNTKCLLACVFKKANYLDDKGMFDLDGAIAHSVADHEGDETKIANSKQLMEICKKVNSEQVSDGEEGCERALILLKCFHENAPQLGFPMHT